MSGWLLAIVGVIYLAVAVDHFTQGNAGFGVCFLCYAGANVGLIMASVRL
jgi:hypothetical protein